MLRSGLERGPMQEPVGLQEMSGTRRRRFAILSSIRLSPRSSRATGMCETAWHWRVEVFVRMRLPLLRTGTPARRQHGILSS